MYTEVIKVRLFMGTPAETPLNNIRINLITNEESPPLLGRIPFFDLFRITFRQSQNTVYFTKE